MTNEERLIGANAENTKIKTPFAKVIVGSVEGKLYYDILWLDPTDRTYHIGYGSYNPDFAFQWLSEYFEIIDAPTVDATPVVHGRWIKAECSEKDGDSNCSECGHWDWNDCDYCSNCGAKMGGGNEKGE